MKLEFKNIQYLYTYQYKDHLGNVRLTYRDGYKNHATQENVKDGIIQVTEIIDQTDYYPFGLKHNNNALADYSAVNKYKYAYNGKELNDELGVDLYDFGARNYDPALGRWLNVDPLAENSRRWTPYNYACNNPVYFIDPDGMQSVANDWKPDENGNLIAELGDTAQTLSSFLGTSEAEVQQMIDNQNLATETINNSVSVKAGETLTLDNVFTKSIKNSTSDLTIDVALTDTSQTGPTPEDYYNCWGSAIAGSQGQEIQVGVGIPEPNTFDSKLASNYTPTTEENAKFGKTVLRFADKENNTQHGAVFYGKSQDGTTYVYTKNGWYLKPQVMKLTDLQTKIPSYGTVQGTNSSNSGYYQPNQP